jgi:valyl-tRNA synthetase
MSTELASTYQPAEVEQQSALAWKDANAFHAEPNDPGKGAPYCIVIPPPNVTAPLHIGHALNSTLQDILIRWHRMCGDNTLWMPGTDHAGIATQTAVEKRILKEQGKRRTDFEREDFVARIQAWKDEYEQCITEQLQAMGCSCDWDRQRFTMDPICTRAVREAFFRLFADGLIYRGKRLVNWDPVTQTALADDEVEMRDIDGHFWYLQYPLEDGSGHVTVATTRPETMLGDTAVAINPNDPRADELRGKHVRLPIVNRIIPIIEDDYVVLPDADSDDDKARYATGYLKVTPAHDPNDWDIGLRHSLPVINVLAPDGTISDQHGWSPEDAAAGDVQFVLGLDRYEARKAIVEWFRQNDLLEDVKPYRHAVGHSYRSDAAIEPYLSDQWYVKVTDDRLAPAALRAMAEDQRGGGRHEGRGGGSEPWEGQLRFFPPRYARTFETWHENIRDWCISRQLWWGHQMPIWTRESNLGVEQLLDRLAKQDDVAIQQFPSSAEVHVCLRGDDPQIIGELEAAGFMRDPDVLDTWFSSALWPISTMGWPDKTAELETWNPSNLLCTAREIITLWVSRMVMFNLYFRGRLPFTDVFIHAMIQDGDGRKMSKSLGNGVDPLDIIHSHGADAMRYTLAAMTTSTQDVRLPVSVDPQTGRNTSDKFDVGRNFANKLWNAVRFVLADRHEGTEARRHEGGEEGELALADRWILSRLARTVRGTVAALGSYEFSQYAQGLYDFFWRDLCDWYIEAVKPTVRDCAMQQRVLATCLDVALRVLHPLMPFVTEKLWQRLNDVCPDRTIVGVNAPTSDLLVTAGWPSVDETLIDEEAESAFAMVQQVTAALRQIRTQHRVPPRQRLTFSASAPKSMAEAITRQADLIGTLAQIDFAGAAPDIEAPTDAAVVMLGQTKLYLHDLVDPDADRIRLTRQIEELDKSMATLQKRLENKQYVDKAPARLVAQSREQLAEVQRQRDSLDQQLAAIE